MSDSNLTIQDNCITALFTAVIAIMAQIVIPMPFGVPMTMQSFAITLAAVILGTRRGTAAAIVYVLLGAIGLPVFHGFTGGFQCLIGPTGGFILSFPVMAWLIGIGIEKYKKSVTLFIIFISLGTFVNLFAGAVMFSVITGSSFASSVCTCILPFLPAAVVKGMLASVMGIKIRKRLAKIQ